MSALPPLAAIRAFEAVARHLSFTKAAEELGMTQAAVSYQIKILEERVGSPLFLRRPRQIALSDVGAQMAPKVGQAFDMLRDAFAESRDRAEGMLSLTVVPTFASRWLASNIGLFQLAHPDIAVRVDSSERLVDLGRDSFDAAIRSTGPLPSGLVGQALCKVEFAPMIAPQLMAQYDIQEPADILRLPQITPDDPWLPAWLQLAGVPNVVPHGRPFIRLGTQQMESMAVMAGHGVGMLTPLFYAEEIAAGRLMQPFKQVGWEGHYYWFAYPEGRRNWSKIKAFRDWAVEATAGLRELEQT